MNDAITDVVEGIVDDILSRKGIGNEWEMIDEDIQEEIKAEWVVLIKRAVNWEGEGE